MLLNKKIASFLKKKNLQGLIITNPHNIFYLSGFRGVSEIEREATLILNPKPTLITARLYQAEAKKLASQNLKVEIVDERNKILEITKNLLKKLNRVGFEETDLKFSEHKDLKKALLIKTKLVPVKHFIEDLRVIKSEEEIKKIEKAQIISQSAFDQIIKTIKVGISEEEIAEKLARIIKNLGGQGLAFESIIASGKNSALPHHKTGKKKIKNGEVLLFDFGAKYQDYCADLSRTIFIGKPKDQHLNIYNHVSLAQQKSINSIKHKVPAKNPHLTSYNHFKQNELHDFFIHGLGHGVGLEVHEKPHLRPKGKELLKEGMVFSVEPGLYFPSWGGVRIEDLITIKNGKAKVLGKLQKDLIIL